MAKLVSARKCRMYGPRLSKSKVEYINAGLYLFGTFVLLCGFAAEFSVEPRAGLILILIALTLMIFVNGHDLLAHLAGIDYRLSLMGFDTQFALVEFAVPAVQVLGSLLFFLGILFLFIQEDRGYGNFKLEKHPLGMLIGGPVLWVLGSIHNSCQIYERADGHVQILQQSVHIPFLIASLLFMVGAILNSRQQAGISQHHGFKLLGINWVWLGICGSLMFVVGGLANVVKVFKMQQCNGLTLEKLRGGAQERLIQWREGQGRRRLPLIVEEPPNRKLVDENGKRPSAPTPYKDVLLSQH